MEKWHQVREVNKFVIGFCGVLFPIVEVRELLSTKFEITHLYNSQQCLEYLEQKKIPTKSLPKRYYRSYYRRRDFSIQDKSLVENFYKDLGWTKLVPVFQEYKVPVFLYGVGFGVQQKHRAALVLNPKLETYKFARAKDPSSAFQDIYMYISGVLGVDTKPMIEIADKYKQAAKGHDGEYSFKKPPGKGRWR